MDAGIEITDPGRFLRVLAVGGGAALVLVLAVGSLFIVPVLMRADRTLDTLEAALPVVADEIAPDVANLRSDVDELPPTVDGVLSTLEEVDSRLSEVNDGVSALEPPLRSVDREITGLRQDVQPISLLADVADAVAVLPEMLEAVRVLPEMLTALRSTRDGVSEVSSHLLGLRDQMDRLLVLIEEVERHVENIDRKTGPIVPPGPEPG